MTNKVNLEKVEQLAMQMTPIDQLKLLARISENLSKLKWKLSKSDTETGKRKREAMANTLLQELDMIAESIEGEFDSAQDIRQIREQRANRL